MEVFECIHAHSNHFQRHQVGGVAVAGAVAAAVAAAVAVAVAVAAAALGVAGVGGCALFYGALWGPCGRYGMCKQCAKFLRNPPTPFNEKP